jgi:hypothetical protein
VIPFILMQLGALVIVGYFPPLVNYLPSRVALLSENAPPPRNPRLQYCVEQILSAQIPAQEARVRQLIAGVRAADVSLLPTGRQRDLERALEGYESSFGLLVTFEETSRAIAAASPGYRPLHREVGDIRRETLRIDRRIGTQEVLLRRQRGDDADTVAARARIEDRIATLRAEREAILARTPERWDSAHHAFLALNRAELAARRDFRQASEQSYAAIRDIAAEARAGEAFEAVLPLLADLVSRVGQDDPEVLAGELRGIESLVSDLPGSGDLSGALRNLRNGLTGRRASPEAAAEAAPAALEQARAEIAWRQQAGGLATALAALEAETRNTLGLREQPRLERGPALQVAGCLADHRDVSLNF